MLLKYAELLLGDARSRYTSKISGIKDVDPYTLKTLDRSMPVVEATDLIDLLTYVRRAAKLDSGRIIGNHSIVDVCYSSPL